MTYPVNSVADYIIEYAKGINKPVNNLKLQKMLYYLQARFLIEGEEPLFDAIIEKWKYGPVIPDVYYRFNHLGAEDIKQVPNDFDFMSLLTNEGTSDGQGELNEEKKVEFEDHDKQLMDQTIEKLIKFKPFDLVDKTHEHNSWIADKERIFSGARHIKYDYSEIKKDFESNADFMIWKH